MPDDPAEMQLESHALDLRNTKIYTLHRVESSASDRTAIGVQAAISCHQVVERPNIGDAVWPFECGRGQQRGPPDAEFVQHMTAADKVLLDIEVVHCWS